MNRPRTAVVGASLVLTAAGLLASVTTSRADDTGISASVDAILELSLEPSGSGHVGATVTTTASHTQLSVTGDGAGRVLSDFAGPVTGQRHRISVHAPTSADGVTVTLGPQGP